MPRSLKIKIDGSGSCEPISPATPGGKTADGLVGAPSIAGFLALGVPVFTWLADEYWVVTASDELTAFDNWCAEHGIGEAGKARILENVPQEEGTYAACRATFHANIALHSQTPPYALIIKTKRALLHVSRLWATWEEAIIDDTKPWAVSMGNAYDLIGNNRATIYLQRTASSGSEQGTNEATYEPVEGQDPPFLPWPSVGDRGLWQYNKRFSSTPAGYAVPYADAKEGDETALALGPREEVLKIEYALPGTTNESGGDEPLQIATHGTSTPGDDLSYSLVRAIPDYIWGLLPNPIYLPGIPYTWEAGTWWGHTGAWRMGQYSRDGAAAFIKIGHRVGTIEAVRAALGATAQDPIEIGHAVPYSDGSLWQQSVTGSNAKIHFVDGTEKTAILPPDAGLQVPYLLHFSETCYATQLNLTVRVFTGSGRRSTPVRCDDHPTEEISLADTPVSAGATTDAEGVTLYAGETPPRLVIDLSRHLRSSYDPSMRAEVWSLDQTVDIEIPITLVRGAKPGTYPVSHLGDDRPTPEDPETFNGYNFYSVDSTIDPDV